MAKYRCLTDLFLPAPGCQYAQAGDILSDVVPTPAGFIPIPSNWVPPLSVDPIDSGAIQSFWNAGPRSSAWSGYTGMMSGNRWSGIAVAPPSVYWVLTGKGWTLNGAAGMGFRPG